ncbi:hypothetical protein BMS3Abin09_00211 [bacterium BMS3Abin09]|nr:hypothetical protein BMS3Abin09_00211 [bacterium BMS3Abin09]
MGMNLTANIVIRHPIAPAITANGTKNMNIEA